MAVQPTDLVVVGRGSSSFRYPFQNFKVDVLEGQESANDARYVQISGDTMTGSLVLNANPGGPLEAATKQYVDDADTALNSSIVGVASDLQQETADRIAADIGITSTFNAALQQEIDNRVAADIGITSSFNVAIQTEIDNRIAGDAYLNSIIVGVASDLQQETADRIAADIGITSTFNASLQTEIDNRIAGDAGIRSDLQAEIDARTAADVGIRSDLQDEIDRATDAENALGTRIDDLILNDLSDVSVGGATTGQAVTWSGTEWIAETVTTEGALVFQGSIDLTNYASAPAITSADAGDLYVNTASGVVDAGYGTGVTNSITNASGSELIAVNSAGTWQYIGVAGGSGLTYDDFSAANVVETSGSKGELAYNNNTGVYTYTKVDLDSRVPTDLSSLPSLP